MDSSRSTAHLVVLMDAADDVDAVIRTIDAANGYGAARVTKAWITGSCSSAIARDLAARAAVPTEVAELTPAGALDLEWEQLDAQYAVFVRAGDQVSGQAIATCARNRRDGIGESIYAMAPSNQYALNPGIARRPVVAIEREPHAIWTGAGAVAVSVHTLARCDSYDLRGGLGTTSLFLAAVRLEGRFGVVHQAVECGSVLDDDVAGAPCAYDPEWYHGLNRFFLSLATPVGDNGGPMPKFFQNVYLYLLRTRMNQNLNLAGDKKVLRTDLPKFMTDVTAVLQRISDSTILSPPRPAATELNRRLDLLRLKGADNRLRFTEYGHDIALTLDDTPVASAASVKVDVDLMNIRGDSLEISGRYFFPYDETKYELRIMYNRHTYIAVPTRRCTDFRIFGVLMHRGHTFDVTIPLARGKVRSLRFYLASKETPASALLDLRFRRPMSRLSPVPGAYWRAGAYILYHKRSRMYVVPNTRRRLVSRELHFLRQLVREGAIAMVVLRALYFATHRRFRQGRIWIYFDKIYKAGDNGEYAYRYASAQADGIRKFYILRGDVPDAGRFKRDGLKFLAYGSMRQKLIFLNAEIVFATHINPQNFGGFAEGRDKYVRDLLRYKLVCIQHGLSVQDLGSTLNRVHDNVTKYCLASPVEASNLSRPEYDYRPDQLVMTGLARYDGLVTDDRRQILIAPTWRSYLAAPYSMGKSRAYSTAFASSPYCEVYNSLINHPRLLAAARAAGYKVVLLLHPVTSSQIDDFRTNDVTSVVASTSDMNYEQILTESSLMVTDYSGIQFDFAYMYKPVVYFHPSELPPSYQEGAYEYETMALGETRVDLDSLVDVLVDYMADSCALKDEYRARIDAFFTFHDRGNCARIYELGLSESRGAGS